MELSNRSPSLTANSLDSMRDDCAKTRCRRVLSLFEFSLKERLEMANATRYVGNNGVSAKIVVAVPSKLLQ